MTMSGNVKAKGGNFNTGLEPDDKDEIQDNAGIGWRICSLKAVNQPADKASLNVTGNAVLKMYLAYSSSEQSNMNFHQKAAKLCIAPM